MPCRKSHKPCNISICIVTLVFRGVKLGRDAIGSASQLHCPEGVKEGSRGQARSARLRVGMRTFELRQGRENAIGLKKCPAFAPAGAPFKSIATGGRATLAPGYLLLPLWGRNFDSHFQLHPVGQGCNWMWKSTEFVSRQFSIVIFLRNKNSARSTGGLA
jgi:hypothetical protein